MGEKKTSCFLLSSSAFTSSPSFALPKDLLSAQLSSWELCGSETAEKKAPNSEIN